ncbi:MAG TPA: hypothetical protein VKW08_00705 [Xanthobacteraceae bacterium]|jgi:hypothetical protein|nr:hypothetical protein [Xanthobacteraceae bacterium]
MGGTLKAAVLAGGLVAMLIGLVWIGQGTGYFPYPSQSFMINEIPWAYGGVVLALVGFVAVAISRRM